MELKGLATIPKFPCDERKSLEGGIISQPRGRCDKTVTTPTHFFFFLSVRGLAQVHNRSEELRATGFSLPDDKQ